MDAQQQPHRPRVPVFRFRVLIIGRANSGKTTILQRVCETTDDPFFYRIFRGKEKVKLDPSMDRGEHRIGNELVFSNHKGYVFHDSRGIESGSTKELGVLQRFIRSKCGEERLGNRLHAIWFGLSSVHAFTIKTTDGHILRYCVPMDNQRPQLDLKFFKDICPDQNVPVVVVFTKYDQFLRNVRINLEDYGNPDDNVSDAAEKQFQEHYLRPLGDGIRFVRLEQMHRENMHCDKLIETTAAALNDSIVGLMLMAVQKDNLELSVKTALKRVRYRTGVEVKHTFRDCLIAFPYLWRIDLLNGSNLDLHDHLHGYFHDRHDLDSHLLRDFGYLDHDDLLQHVMSLPTFQNITYDSLNGHHLIIAVIVIFKHATFLRLKGLSSESSLTQAELDYREANTDLIIQEHLTGSSQDSVELSASFIMATDIESSRSSVKEHWFKRLLNQRSHANLEDPHKEGLLDSVSNGPGNV